MFQLIAIIAFFVLGLAFFAIGKDDFGIKRIKEDSSNNGPKVKEKENIKGELNEISTQKMQEVSNKNQSDSSETPSISN